MRRPCIAAGLVLAALADATVATQSRLPRDQGYTSTATAILVDVVVRDRRGRQVTDLSAEDFALFEDGRAQKIDSFTRVSRGGGIGVGVAWKSAATAVTTSRPADSAKSPATSEDVELPTTALVFDRLSTESLRLAQRATLGHIPMSGEPSSRIAVFASDPGVQLLQAYTTEPARVRHAVERVLPSGTASTDQSGDRTKELVARRRQIDSQGDSTTAQAAGGNSQTVAQNASAIGQRESERHMVQLELNMLQSFESLERDAQGYQSSLALFTVIDSLRLYPGRKTIVFFSEGLPASPVLSARLDRVIEAANRANVTAYVVDAHGLRAQSTLTSTRKEMEDYVDERMRQLASARDETNQPLTMAFERVEDTMRLDSRTGLARLAEDTGGILLDGTNDLSGALRRIDEDNQFHYLLSYSPTNGDLDGTYRKIDVKVGRAGSRVFARRGYRAVRAAPPVAAALEGAALGLLDRTRLPTAFPVQAAAFTFPDALRPGLTPILVRVNTNALRFDVDAQRATYAAEALILVRLRDEAGRDVQKLSQQYTFSGDAKDVDAARNGEVLFYREADLAPGVYTIESIVFDGHAQHGSARLATLTVPRRAEAELGISSLVLVNRVEQVSDVPRTNPAPPLYVGSTLLYPNLGEPLRRSSGELPFYFTAYGDLSRLECSAQLLRNGEVLATAPVTLPSATGTRVQHVGSLPISSLVPGVYELRIRIGNGKEEASATAYFTLID